MAEAPDGSTADGGLLCASYHAETFSEFDSAIDGIVCYDLDDSTLYEEPELPEGIVALSTALIPASTFVQLMTPEADDQFAQFLADAFIFEPLGWGEGEPWVPLSTTKATTVRSSRSLAASLDDLEDAPRPYALWQVIREAGEQIIKKITREGAKKISRCIRGVPSKFGDDVARCADKITDIGEYTWSFVNKSKGKRGGTNIKVQNTLRAGAEGVEETAKKTFKDLTGRAVDDLPEKGRAYTQRVGCKHVTLRRDSTGGLSISQFSTTVGEGGKQIGTQFATRIR
jgi:hypothetical protein